jgi:hypothetical protein
MWNRYITQSYFVFDFHNQELCFEKTDRESAMQFKLDQALEVLSQTPEVMNALLRGKSQEWLNCRGNPQAFSPLDVVGHLMHADRTDWIPRVRQILNGDGTVPFEAFDRFGFQSLLSGKSAETVLDEFGELRRQSLRTVRDFGIGDRELELPGTHPELGSVRLSNLLATWVVHDLGHISQVVRTMSNEYHDAVGPWRAYLTILK